MSEDGVDPKKEEEWQAYLRRRKRGKRILILGTIILVSSSVIAILTGAVAAFSGTPYVPAEWNHHHDLTEYDRRRCPMGHEVDTIPRKGIIINY